MSRLWSCLLLTCLVLVVAPASAAAGPVILGGDDLTEHGRVDAAGNPQEGWLYMQRAIANISPKVTRLNDNTIAALGSSAGPPTDRGNAGAAIGVAAARNGLGVNYYDGAPALTDFFARLRDGRVRPRIIWIAGSLADNDLGLCRGEEDQVITRNAESLDQYVTNGGGLMSHGVCYDWASSLLPGLQAPETGAFRDLFLTPEGTAAFPGLTNDDVNAGPWHNHFQGNLGGLLALVRSSRIDDAASQDAAVVIGGGAVSIRPPPPPTCVNPTVVRDRRVSLPGGGSAVLATRQFTDAATPFRATVRLRRQTARSVTYIVNGRTIAVNVPAGRQVRVPAAALKRGRGRNQMVAIVTLLSGRTVRITQFFVIVRCSVPRVACRRISARSLRCTSRTPLGVRRVTATAASPAGGTARGTATVRRGRYTVTLRAPVTLPAGRYTYRHVGRTRKRGERMVMIRYVNVT
jgi:hypothetical protein